MWKKPQALFVLSSAMHESDRRLGSQEDKGEEWMNELMMMVMNRIYQRDEKDGQGN